MPQVEGTRPWFTSTIIRIVFWSLTITFLGFFSFNFISFNFFFLFLSLMFDHFRNWFDASFFIVVGYYLIIAKNDNFFWLSRQVIVVGVGVVCVRCRCMWLPIIMFVFVLFWPWGWVGHKRSVVGVRHVALPPHSQIKTAPEPIAIRSERWILFACRRNFWQSLSGIFTAPI